MDHYDVCEKLVDVCLSDFKHEARACRENMFVATPTHIIKDYCAREFAVEVSSRFLPENVFILCNSKEDMQELYSVNGIQYLHAHLDDSYFNEYGCIQRRVVISMNILRHIFLHHTPKLDWFISLEADVIMNNAAFNELVSTLNSRPDIVVLHTECYHGFQDQLAAQYNIVEVERMTLGFTAIHRSVLERFKFKVNPEAYEAFHDAHFAMDCVANGIKIHYNPKIVVDHRDSAAYNGRGWQNLSLRERGIV
jgi:hypothetical protein